MCICGYIWVYVYEFMCLCFFIYICVYAFEENLKFQRVLVFLALLLVISNLISSSQYAGSNALKLHKITDLC